MGFILVAYYTAGSIYEESAMKLMKSAEKLSVPCAFEKILDRGSWGKNTEYKPTFIRDCMIKYPNCNIAYTDADSMIHEYPILFDDPLARLIIRKQDFRWRKNEFMSGTFFMRNDVDCRMIVDSWINKVAMGETVRSNPQTWEQYHLGQAILESGIEWLQLPHKYIYYDHIEHAEGFEANPVFTHMQFSRKITQNRNEHA